LSVDDIGGGGDVPKRAKERRKGRVRSRVYILVGG
jgi:hypothetical protein